MASLYKRAAPAQERLIRIVEGAVLNAADAHSIPRDPWLARSIAKRAAGTLSSQWREVLAVNTRPSETGAVSGVRKCRACERRAHLAMLRVRKRYGVCNGTNAAERRAYKLVKRPPLLELWERLKRGMWAIKQSNDIAKFEATRDLLRMIDSLQKEIEELKIDLNKAPPSA